MDAGVCGLIGRAASCLSLYRCLDELELELVKMQYCAHSFPGRQWFVSFTVIPRMAILTIEGAENSLMLCPVQVTLGRLVRISGLCVNYIVS